MKTHKKCKGSGKALGYGCGLPVDVRYRKYGLGTKCCYANWLYSSEDGKAMIEKATLKATAPRKELEKATIEKKERDSLGWLLTNTKTACHNWVKARDRGKECASCGQPWSKDHQAGHWKKAELYSTLKFNEHNIHNQCVGCNIHKDGNVQEYGDRIHLRIGREGKAEIERLAELDHSINFKWDREELKKTRKYYQTKLKALKQ